MARVPSPISNNGGWLACGVSHPLLVKRSERRPFSRSTFCRGPDEDSNKTFSRQDGTARGKQL